MQVHFDIKNLNNMTKIRHDFESFLLAKLKKTLLGFLRETIKERIEPISI